MINSPSLTVAFVIIILFILAQRHVYATCDSPQYADYGQRGIIKCTFTLGFKGVFWYMSVNSEYQIIIRLEQQEDGSMVPSGGGYTEGKFDILPDGSLVILNNTNYHDQSFKIVLVDKNSHVEERYVEVLIRIISHHDFPVITVCNGTKLCIIENTDVSILTCSFQHSRPPVEIQWYRQSHEGIDKLEAETLKTKDGKWTFSSTSSINITSLINGPLIALTCRVSSPALKSQALESTVVIDTTEQPWPSLQEGVSEDKYFFIDSQAEVPCNDNAKPFIFVWKQLNRNDSKTLAFATNDTTGFVVNLNTTLNVTEDGSLIIPSIRFENEGLYSCTFFDGTRYISDVKQVNVFVPPSPPTIIADGCSKDKTECEIFLPDTIFVFNISCRLFGVYPEVTLAMDNTLYSDTKQISRYTYSVERGSLYDCSVTNEFPPIGCSASMNVTCFLSRPGPLVALMQDKVISVRSVACEETGSKAPIIITSVLIVILSCICISTLFWYRRRIHTLREDIEKRQPQELEHLNPTSAENEGATEKKEPKLEDDSVDSTNGVPEDIDKKEVYSGKNKDQFPTVRMKEAVDLILNYPMKHAINNSLFDKDVIETIHNTPVKIGITKNVSVGAKIAGAAISVFGAALAFVTFGFGAVLVVAGAALGVTGVAIGLSSKEIFEDESKWRKARPAFESLIKIQRDIAKMTAITSIGYNTIESFSKEQRFISTELIGNMHIQTEESLKRIKNKDCSNMEDLLDDLSSTIEKTVLEIVKLTNPPEANRLQMARDKPFNNLCEDILACHNNVLTMTSTSSFVDVIEMMFCCDRNGKVQFDVIRDSNKRTEIIKDSITKVERGVLAAGIILRAAGVDTNIEFLGTTAQNLLESKNDEHKTLSLNETADLMEKMNAIFEKL